MPWPKEHKRETHQRILEAAARAFREHGIADVGVAELMKRVGLTHGGFYAHFSSKEELLADAFVQAAAEVSRSLERAAGGQPSRERDPLLSLADAYLSPQHLQHPESGCPVAALGPELVRSSKNVRQKLAEAIRKRLQALVDLLPADIPPADRQRRTTGVLACMVGGLILARGLPESEGVQVLNDCRSFLRESLKRQRPESG